MRILILIATIFALVGCTREAPDCGALEVADAWVRAVPAGAGMTGGYLRLQNPGDTSVRVVGAESAAFGRVEMHRSVGNDGQMRMKPVQEVTVPSGGNMSFAPGDRHLMLFEPGEPIAAGDRVPMRLSCGNAHVAFKAEVRERAPDSGSGA